MDQPRITILGLGNELLQDDGVGIQAVRMLLEDPPPDTELIEIGTAALNAMPFLEHAGHVLAIDALTTGAPAGTLHHFQLDDLEHAVRSAGLHDLGLHVVIGMLPPEQRPESVEVWGLEPAEVGYGMELTPAVAEALPGLCAAIRGRVDDILRQRNRG
jgi:hydrogenase maturation protease